VVTDFKRHGEDVFIFALGGVPIRELIDSILEQFQSVEGNDGSLFVGIDVGTGNQQKSHSSSSDSSSTLLCRVSAADRGQLYPSGFLSLEHVDPRWLTTGSKIRFYALSKTGAVSNLERHISDYTSMRNAGKRTAVQSERKSVVQEDNAAVVFSCLGRGVGLHDGEEDVESSVMAKRLSQCHGSSCDAEEEEEGNGYSSTSTPGGSDANFDSAGFFGGGEVGPISTALSGGKNCPEGGMSPILHSFATTIAIFR